MAGCFDEVIDVGEDTALLLRLALHFPARYVPTIQTLMRQHPARKINYDRRHGRHWEAGMYLFPSLLGIIPDDRPKARRLVARRLTVLTMVQLKSTTASRTEFVRAVVEGYRKQLGTEDRRHLAYVTASTMVSWYSRNQRTVKVEEIVETFAKIEQECEPDQINLGATEGALHGALLWVFLRRMAFTKAGRLTRYLLRQRVGSVMAEFLWSAGHSAVAACCRVTPEKVVTRD